jgi:transcriptional regulator with XRE-family HTH domain
MAEAEQALVIQPPRSDDYELFDALPIVLRFLRLEKGAEPEKLDSTLRLSFGTYASFESGMAIPSLAILDRILVYFSLDLTDLGRRLKALAEVRWPSLREPTRNEEGNRTPWPSADDFLRASEVIRDFELSHIINPERWRPPAHGFASFGEALRWLRGFLHLSEDEVAKLAGLTTRSIRTLEAGKRQPSKDTRYSIGRFVQPIYNNLLAASGVVGVRPYWDPPETAWMEDEDESRHSLDGG